jgi:hypothetical protein
MKVEDAQGIEDAAAAVPRRTQGNEDAAAAVPRRAQGG